MSGLRRLQITKVYVPRAPVTAVVRTPLLVGQLPGAGSPPQVTLDYLRYRGEKPRLSFIVPATGATLARKS